MSLRGVINLRQPQLACFGGNKLIFNCDDSRRRRNVKDDQIKNCDIEYSLENDGKAKNKAFIRLALRWELITNCYDVIKKSCCNDYPVLSQVILQKTIPCQQGLNLLLQGWPSRSTARWEARCGELSSLSKA